MEKGPLQSQPSSPELRCLPRTAHSAAATLSHASQRQGQWSGPPASGAGACPSAHCTSSTQRSPAFDLETWAHFLDRESPRQAPGGRGKAKAEGRCRSHAWAAPVSGGKRPPRPPHSRARALWAGASMTRQPLLPPGLPVPADPNPHTVSAGPCGRSSLPALTDTPRAGSFQTARPPAGSASQRRASARFQLAPPPSGCLALARLLTS